MERTITFLVSGAENGTMLPAVNERLAIAGLSITREDALIHAERRAESLAEAGRVEFGSPAVIAIAEALASSAFLMQGAAADILAELQGAFYTLRDDLPADVQDAEIVEALRGCFDAHEGELARADAGVVGDDGIKPR